MHWNTAILPAVVSLAATFGLVSMVAPAAEDAPGISGWLVAGPFENDPSNGALRRDLLGEAGEAGVRPAEGDRAGGRTWTFFDDRLFSRNYDDYVDLFSHFDRLGLLAGKPRAACAHIYVHSVTGRAAELRLGALNGYRARWNGEEIGGSDSTLPHRDLARLPLRIRPGWNRLLLKVATPVEGRLGFWARIAAADGGEVPGLTCSPDGDRPAALAIATRSLAGSPGPSLPAAFREWPYVEADALRDPEFDIAGFLRKKPWHALRAGPLVLAAGGGAPPYRWSIEGGALPAGLALEPGGAIRGTVAAGAPLGDHPFRARVTDSAGAAASKDLVLTVRDRPNRWYEEARLVALIHAPETILGAPEEDLALLARTLRLQGYRLGMMIAYNNGDFRYRFPNRFEPGVPDIAGRYKAALEKEGIRFGLYLGNLIGPNHGGDDGALVLVAEAVERYRPAALWFDWASPDPDGYVSLDALYGAIRARSPETLLVLNGVVTCYQGDWDAICHEGWGAWGERMWSLWPFRFRWPKAVAIESWRLVPDPAFEYSKGIEPDWREYLRVQISLIGDGFVADIDHSPTITQPYRRLEESKVFRAHREMAAWASPEGKASLVSSYTDVLQGPFAGDWGYSLMSRGRDTVYLHVLENPLGKTGMPRTGRIILGPLERRARSVAWMNRDRPLPFSQAGGLLELRVDEVAPDPIDTVIAIAFDGPLPPFAAPSVTRDPIPPGNLATGRPARLLSIDGERDLVPSAFQFARFGVDGRVDTCAQGAHEWAWMYGVDLEEVHPLRRIAIRFGKGGWATEYVLLVSVDGREWREAARAAGSDGGRHEHAFDPPAPVRMIRVRAVKPDGPDQPGAQMGIAELEAYR